MKNTQFPFLSTVFIAVASMLMAKALELASSSKTELNFIDGNYQMEVQSVHGNSYFYQHSTDLINWKYLPHIQYGTGNILKQNLADPLGNKNFFRVKDTSHPTVDPKNDDFDGDGISNYNEVRIGGTGTDPFIADTDGDGKSDYETDTNNDGFHDGWALDNFNDLDFDPEADDDQDGINNGQEAIDGSNPHIHADTDDTDEDGLTDAEEIALGSDPFNKDTDDDKLIDGQDADPLDKAITWKKIPEQQYSVLDIGLPANVNLADSWNYDLGEGGHVMISKNLSSIITPWEYSSQPKTIFETYVWSHSKWSQNLPLSDNLRGVGAFIDAAGDVHCIGRCALIGRGENEDTFEKNTHIDWKKNLGNPTWQESTAEYENNLAASFTEDHGSHFGMLEPYYKDERLLYGSTGRFVVKDVVPPTVDNLEGSASIYQVSPALGGPLVTATVLKPKPSYIRLVGEPGGWHAATWDHVDVTPIEQRYKFAKLIEPNTVITANPPEAPARWRVTAIASIATELLPTTDAEGDEESISDIVIWQTDQDGFEIGKRSEATGNFTWQASTKADATQRIGGKIHNRGEGLKPLHLWRNGRWSEINNLIMGDQWLITQTIDINSNGSVLAKAKRLKNADGTPIPAANQENTLVLLATIDLVVDSDNDDGTDFPSGGEEEILAGGEFTTSEDLIKYPGKILYSQNGDIDIDGVPDYADGFSDGKYTTSTNGIARTGLSDSQLNAINGATAIAEVNTPQTASMVPIILRLPKGMTSQLSVQISYTGSDPKKITKELKNNRHYYMLPAEGDLRLWAKNRQTEDCSVIDFGAGEDTGDYIPNSITLGKDELEKLNYDSAQGGYILWLESVATSEEIRDQSIRFQITRVDQNGGTGFQYIDKTAYFTTINMNLVQLHQDGTGEAATGEISMSHTSPVIESKINVTKPRWGVIKDLTSPSAGKYGWVVDITVEGSILSPLLDTLTPEQGGTIEKAFLYANGVDDHIREINVAVTKGYKPNDILAPFPYKGTIDQTFTGVEVIDGINILEVRTADKVYRLDGYHQHSFTAQLPENPPENYDEDPSQPDPESLSMHQRGYVLKPHFDPAKPHQTLSDVDTYTISAEGNVILTNLIIHRSTDPLEPDEFRDANNNVHLKITPYTVRSIPRVSGQPFEYFRPSSLHLYLYSGFAMDGHSVLCTYCPPPLDDDGNPTTAPDGRDEYCGLITTFSSSGQQIQITDAEPIDQSDGGEFHPYIWELAGPLNLIESMQGLQISDTSRSSVDVDVPGGSRKVEFNADVAKVKLEIAEEARRVQEENDRAFLANSFNSAVPGIVSFKPAELAQQKAISDEFFAAVNRVKALELYPESELDFAKGVAVGVAKGGVEMVGGLKDAVVLVGKVALGAGVAVIRGIGFGLKVIWKLSTGQSLEQERRQAAEIRAKARKAKEWIVKKYQFFKELMDESNDILLLILSGDFRKLNHLSGHMRTMISFSIELFVGLLEKYGSKSDYEKGYFVGRAIFEVGSLFIGVGIIAKAGQVAARVSKAQFLTKLADKSTMFKGSGAAADVMTNVKNGFGKLVRFGKVKGRACFVAGTLVATASADDDLIHYRPIENVRENDLAWARSESTGELVKRPVVKLYTTYPRTLHHLHIDTDADGITDEVIDGSKEHPFWNETLQDWQAMGELEEGHQLYLQSGKNATVILNQRERAPPNTHFTTYNLEVAEHHSYFVGKSGAWVHNFSSKFCDDFLSLTDKVMKDKGIKTQAALKGRRFEVAKEALEEMSRKGKILDSRSGFHVMHTSQVEEFAEYTGDLTGIATARQLKNLQAQKGAGGKWLSKREFEIHHTSEKWMSKALGIPENANILDSCPGIPLRRKPNAVYDAEYKKNFGHNPVYHSASRAEGGLAPLLGEIRGRYPAGGLSPQQKKDMLRDVKDLYRKPPYDKANMWPVTRDWLELHIDTNLLPD